MNFRLAIHILFSLLFFVFLMIYSEDFSVFEIATSFVLFWFIHFLILIFFERNKK